VAAATFSRTANALVEATASTLKTGKPARDLPDLADSLDEFEILSPGSWVGGVPSIFDFDVSFMPNALNRSTYVSLAAGIGTITAPFSSIRSVEIEAASVTNIVRIRTSEFVVSARCFGARSGAARIRADASMV
jgi:hypothetical protein